MNTRFMIHPEIFEIERPKLLMTAAKDLFNRRKDQGKKNLPIKDIEKIVQNEKRLEFLRTTHQNCYCAEEHIRSLADIIEFIDMSNQTLGPESLKD